MKCYVLKFTFVAVFLTIIAGAIVIYPERYIAVCFQGFAMWAECVLPALFPFMVITLIMIKSGFAKRASLPLRKVTSLLHLPPSAAVCFVISIFSGYPAGSRCLLEFYESGALTGEDVKKLSVMCSTSGPLFIIGSIGVKMLGDKGAGWKILLAHAASVLIISVVLCLIPHKSAQKEFRRAPINSNVLYDSFYDAVISVIVAGGFIAFFSVAARVLSDFNFLIVFEKLFSLFTNAQSAEALSFGLVEATVGCRTLAATECGLKLSFCGFIITFGGGRILAQQLAYLKKCGVGGFYFIGVKLLQGVMCFCLLLGA